MNPSRVRWGLCIAIGLTLLVIRARGVTDKDWSKPETWKAVEALFR